MYHYNCAIQAFFVEHIQKFTTIDNHDSHTISDFPCSLLLSTFLFPQKCITNVLKYKRTDKNNFCVRCNGIPRSQMLLMLQKPPTATNGKQTTKIECILLKPQTKTIFPAFYEATIKKFNAHLLPKKIIY